MNSFINNTSNRETSNMFYNLTAVFLPEETFGNCENWRKCKSFDVSLGNGLCMNCYDNGLRNRVRSEE